MGLPVRHDCCTNAIVAVSIRTRDNEHESVSISEAIVDIQKIELRVEQLHEAFQNVSAVGEMSATMQMSISKSVVAIQDSERRGVRGTTSGFLREKTGGNRQQYRCWFSKVACILGALHCQVMVYVHACVYDE